MLVPYDQEWPRKYCAEAAVLRAAVDGLVSRFEHVGSTSIPGLASKPIIDVQLSVVSLDQPDIFIAPLAAAGYVHVPDPDPEFERVYPLFQKSAAGTLTYHVHLCVLGSPLERRHLAFRDYLRDHAEVAQRYESLKRSLVAMHGMLATKANRLAYTAAKGPFIEDVIARAFDAGYPKHSDGRARHPV